MKQKAHKSNEIETLSVFGTPDNSDYTDMFCEYLTNFGVEQKTIILFNICNNCNILFLSVPKRRVLGQRCVFGTPNMTMTKGIKIEHT